VPAAAVYTCTLQMVLPSGAQRAPSQSICKHTIKIDSQSKLTIHAKLMFKTYLLSHRSGWHLVPSTAVHTCALQMVLPSGAQRAPSQSICKRIIEIDSQSKLTIHAFSAQIRQCIVCPLQRCTHAHRESSLLARNKRKWSTTTTQLRIAT
jgi:hypothetical protein